LIGLLVVFMKTIVMTLLGIILGFIAGNLLFNVTVKMFTIDPIMLYWIEILSCIAIFALFVAWNDQWITIMVTSAVGSFFLVRGISIFLGGFPDESFILMLVQHNEYQQVGYLFGSGIYGYILGMVIAFVVGIIVQCYTKTEKVEEKKEEPKDDEKKEEKDKKFHRIERSYGSFMRSFRLPDDVDEAAVKAEFKDGMINVTMPKSAKAKAKSVNVTIS